MCNFRASKQLKMCFGDSSDEEKDDKDSDTEDISSEEGEGNVDDATDVSMNSSESEDDVSKAIDKSPPDIEPEQGTSRTDRNDNNSDVPLLKAASSSSKGQLMYKGVQLFPPDKRKSTSFAWHHGGFKKMENGQLDRSKVFCAHCGVDLKYNGTPSILTNHLERLHKDELKPNIGKAAQSLITDFSAPAETKVKKLSSTHPLQVKFKNEIVRWVIESLRPLKIVTDKRLVNAFELANSALSVPSMLGRISSTLRSFTGRS